MVISVYTRKPCLVYRCTLIDVSTQPRTPNQRTPNPRTPNPRGSGELLRSELVNAARELLLTPREGLPFSLRALARAVGVTPTAVYRHFDSAEDLVTAVIDDQSSLLSAAVGTLDGELSVDTLARFGLRYVEWGLANPGAYQLLFESAERYDIPVGPGTPGYSILEDVATWLHDGGREPAVELATRAWAALHGLTSLRLHKPTLPWPTTIRHEVDEVARMTVVVTL